jgi:hypothetical protein
MDRSSRPSAGLAGHTSGWVEESMAPSLSWFVLGAGALGLVLGGCKPAPAPPYDVCVTNADCTAAVDGCATVAVDYVDYRATGGICTDNCDSSVDCPYDGRGIQGACLSFDGGANFVCFERCVSDFDCPGGFSCQDRTWTGTAYSYFEPICLPSG